MLQSFEPYTIGSIFLIFLRQMLQSFGSAVGWGFLILLLVAAVVTAIWSTRR
jgi:hypothetical protein